MSHFESGDGMMRFLMAVAVLAVPVHAVDFPVYRGFKLSSDFHA